MINHILRFAIDQAIIAGRLKKNVKKKFKTIPSPIISRDNKGLAQSMNSFSEGLGKAQDRNWVDKKQAKMIFNMFISQIGTEMSDDDDDNDNKKDKKEEDDKDEKE